MLIRAHPSTPFSRSATPGKGWTPPAFYYPKATPLTFLPAHEQVQGVMFLHETTNPAGDRRLVLVRVHALEFSYSSVDLFLTARAFGLASWDPKSRVRPLGYWSDGAFHFRNEDGLRFYAGQPDPSDSTHFTIRYVFKGQHGIIDGRVRTTPASTTGPAADYVEMTVRNGPLQGWLSPTRTNP